MLDLVWLAIFFPLAGALVNGLGGRFINNKLVSGIIGCSALGLSFATAIGVWYDYSTNLTPRESPFYEVILWPWIHVGTLKLDAALLLDPLSITFLLFVTGVSFLIHIYSTGYMSHDQGYSRFFTYLNLFVAMMLILVLGNSAVTMFVGWEGVGLCSYLLIGFWYHDMHNANCGMKAFVVNRIGDFGVLIGVFLLFMYFGTLRFTDIFEQAPVVLGHAEAWVPLAIALFLFLGATGKSAQFPLHIWLPDAMAGPTPVSALIHAATMVTAGVYMVTRLNPIFTAAPLAGLIVALVGAFTAFMAGTIALTQNDIKKVLAYSTVSQLGYMFLACGVGAYSVAIFHVVTHAFFKACLFLGSGSVIHGMHEEQDTRYMGRLWKFMPWTYGTFLVSTFAIAGIIPFAGFFSKDEILWQVAVWQAQWPWAPPLLYVVGIVTAFMTAFYMGRVTFKTFLGPQRFKQQFREKHQHPHESRFAMVMPLVVLAILAVISGAWMFTPQWMFGGHKLFEEWLAPSASIPLTDQHHARLLGDNVYSALQVEGLKVGAAGGHAAESAAHHEPFVMFGTLEATEIAFAAFSVVLALLALGWAWTLFTKRYVAEPEQQPTAKWKKQFKLLYLYSLNKWYFDEEYHTVIVVPGVAMAYFSWRVLDLKLIDGIVNGAAWLTGAVGQAVRPLQTGFVRNYALYILLGAALYLIFNIVK